VVGSWLVDLIADALAHSPDLDDFTGRVSDSGEGRWTVLAAVDKHQTGMASGFNSAVARLGGLIVVALMGAVLMGQGDALLEPFSKALVVMGIVAALGGVAAFFGLGGKWKRHEPEPGQVS